MNVAEFLNDLECELAKQRVEATAKAPSHQYSWYHSGQVTALEYVFHLTRHWGLQVKEVK